MFSFKCTIGTLWLILRIVIIYTLIITLGVEGFRLGLWLLNQPSDLAFAGGVAVSCISTFVSICWFVYYSLSLIFTAID